MNLRFKTMSLTLKKGGSYFAEVGNLPTFMAENRNVARFQRISDTKTVLKTDISYARGSENAIVNVIVTDIGNNRS